MKSFSKLTFGLTLAALSAVTLNSAVSFAYYDRGPRYGYHNNGAGAGILDALLTSYSLLATSALSQPHNDDTLLVEAAQYEDTKVKGAVFNAFAQQMVVEMTKQLGDQINKVSSEQLDDMIAQQILNDSSLAK